MEHKRLGSTEMYPSPIGLGTCPHRYATDTGTQLTLEARVDTIRFALESGINYIDTAPAYGFLHLEKSETAVGAATDGIERSSFYLTTKSQGSHEWETDKFKNLAMLQRYFETSLKRLRTDYFDGYLLHDIPVVLETPDAISECVKEIQKYKEQGLVGAIGVGTVELGIAEKVLEQGWADIIQLGGSYQCLNGGSLPPEFILELQAQGLAFINCQIFCTLEKDAPLNLRREALAFSVVNSPVVDLSLIGMHTRHQIVENISTIDSIFNHENPTV